MASKKSRHNNDDSDISLDMEVDWLVTSSNDDDDNVEIELDSDQRLSTPIDNDIGMVESGHDQPLGNEQPQIQHLSEAKEPVESTECEVCAKESCKKLVRCKGCGYVACLVCTKAYLLSTMTNRACCMSCRVAWSPQFMYANFPRTWVDKDYRKRQREVLIERERALLPESMSRLRSQAYIDALNGELAGITDQLIALKRRHDILNDTCRVTTQYRLGTRLGADIGLPARYEQTMEHFLSSGEVLTPGELRARLNGVNNLGEAAADAGDDDIALANVQKTNYLCPCPYNDHDGPCRGLVTSHFKCSVCDRSVCRRCRVPIAKDTVTSDTVTSETGETEVSENDVHPAAKHVCQESDLKTIELLRKDSKPCPTCAVAIFKISGCSQMFCTHCKTVFDWNTMKIDNGIVHNPYAVEWRRLNGGGGDQQHPQQQCDGWVQSHELLTRFVTDHVYIKQWQKLMAMHRAFAHALVELDKLNRQLETRPAEFVRLRLGYLSKTLSEDEWAKAVNNRERVYERTNMRAEIYRTFTDIVNGLFRAHVRDMHDRDRRGDTDSDLGSLIDRLTQQFEEVLNFCNKGLDDLVYLGSSERSIKRIETWKPFYDELIQNDWRAQQKRRRRTGRIGVW